MFTFFILTEKLNKMDVRAFTKIHALALWIISQHLEAFLINISYNSYLTQIKSLFGELVNRAILDSNPFSQVKTKAEKQTARRLYVHQSRLLRAIEKTFTADGFRFTGKSTGPNVHPQYNNFAKGNHYIRYSARLEMNIPSYTIQYWIDKAGAMPFDPPSLEFN